MVKIRLGLDQRLVKNNAGVTLSLSDKGKELLTAYDHYTINKEQLKSFTGYIEKIMDKLEDFDIQDRDIHNFFWLYDFNLENILTNIKEDHRELIINVVKYIIDLSSHYNSSLQIRAKESKVASSIMDRVNSYKFLIKGILNYSALFARFNYFIIPTFVKSTGRRFSSTLFLSLQNMKLA